MITLRADQQAAADAIREEYRRGNRRVCLQAPTGWGKRYLACHTLAAAAARGKTCVLLQHRQELIDQACDTLRSAGVPHGVLAGGVGSSLNLPVQVGSIATVARRILRLPAPDFVFVDEAHHAASATWSRILAHWNRSYVLGLTATPQRLDGKGLARYFDALVIGPSVAALIQARHLADFRLYAPPTHASLEGIKTVAGDYARDALAAAYDRAQITGDIVAHYQRLAPGKRCVVFAVTRQHARNLAEAFLAAGIAATYVGGDTPRDGRRDILERFRCGALQALCSVDI